MVTLVTFCSQLLLVLPLPAVKPGMQFAFCMFGNG